MIVKKKIRKMTVEDVPFYNSIRNECSQFLHDTSTYTLPQSYRWYRQNKSPFFIYEVNGESVGYFRTSNWKDNNCYVGMDIHKDYRGKKLAYDAYIMFFDLLHNEYNINGFYLEVMQHNKRASNLYHKLGFKIQQTIILDNNSKKSILMYRPY